MAKWTVPATLVRIIDGDTVVCDLDLGWNISLRSSVRLLGINAPEASDHPSGDEATAYLATLVAPGDPVTVVSTKLLGTTEKYGRVLASVESGTGVDLSTAMLAAGHATPDPG